MTSKSKSKGNMLERDMRDFFNNLYDTKEFARTPSSGALMGLSNARVNVGLEHATKQTLGSDLICPQWFKFSVECKNYADKPNYSIIIKGSDKTLDGWLAEACYDSINFDLIPMLVFRTTRQGTHIAIPDLFLEHIDPEYFAKYREFIIIGVDNYAPLANTIRDAANNYHNEFMHWLKTSHCITGLLTQLADDRLKSKKEAGASAIMEMVQVRNAN